MEPGPLLAASQAPSSARRRRWPDPDEEEVAVLHADVLGGLGRGEVIGRHMITRLEPGQAAQPRNVQQHSAA